MSQKSNRRRPRIRQKLGRGSRQGAVVLELILTLPIWLIALLAIIQFGEVYANRQQVALASRVGAEEASETATLSTTNTGDPVPMGVLDAINDQLASSDISFCKVVLEHNVGLLSTTLQSGSCNCPVPGAPFPTDGRYVRVTVFTEMTQVTPNLLRTFGFDVSDRVLHHTTTFRHEL